jgi:hypothetical protein
LTQEFISGSLSTEFANSVPQLSSSTRKSLLPENYFEMSNRLYKGLELHVSG